MVSLKGEHVYLRALEPEDLDFVFSIENDENFWEVSNTQTPYSRFLIKQYLEHSHKDIYEVKQLRLVISSNEHKILGLIDIFDFDFKNSRAGIGILIKETIDRQKGFGSEALKLVIDYCDAYLGLHQLFCNISEDNSDSLRLFKSHGFETIGLKKDWNSVNGSYKSEYLLQRIN